MEKQTKKIVTPSISYGDQVLAYKENILTVTATEPYKCKYCSEEITIGQIEKTLHDTKCLSSSKIEFVNKILPLINKYREKYKLDTCLRKAHFIAQIGAEMGFVDENLTEGTSYHHSALLSKFSKFTGEQEINDIILNSLKKYLKDIFKITDKDGNTIVKTNEKLKVLLKKNKVIINDSELYGRRDRKSDKEKIIKTINKTVIKEGKQIEIVDYNIVLLKRVKPFGVETLSRIYANSGGNGDELSRHGYIYRGRGLKQITKKRNYEKFSKYRKDNPFELGETYIDFTKVTDKVNYKGNFELVSKNITFAVQSALWFWLSGNKKKGNGNVYKYSVDWADEDNIEWISRTLNGGHNGKKTRRDNTIRARKAFNVYEHYKLTHENGSVTEKKQVEDQLLEISKTRKVRNADKKEKIDLKDQAAGRLYEQLTAPVIEIQQMSFQKISVPVEIKADLPNIKILLESLKK